MKKAKVGNEDYLKAMSAATFATRLLLSGSEVK
jgi:hypothetical protein